LTQTDRQTKTFVNNKAKMFCDEIYLL